MPDDKPAPKTITIDVREIARILVEFSKEVGGLPIVIRPEP